MKKKLVNRVQLIASIGVAATTLALSVGGCPLGTNDNGNSNANANTNGSGYNQTAKTRLSSFASPQDLLNYFKERVAANRTRSSFFPLFSTDIAATPTAAAGGASEGAANATSDAASFTNTNTQETGVDESDIVKTDGENIYIARGTRLSIVKAEPRGEMKLRSEVELNAGDNASEMYLVGDKVLLLAQTYGDVAPYYGWRGGGAAIDVLIWPPYYYNAKTVVYQIDVTNADSPSIEKRVEMDGNVASSRLTGGRLILVMTVVPNVPQNPGIFQLASITLDDILPKLEGPGGTQDLVPWQEWYRPDPENGYYTTAVVALDARDIESVISSTAIMASVGTVYASTEALYVTDTDYTTDGTYRPTTAIHKFAFDSDGGASYVASGTVPGRLLNQFSMDESNGHLRVATYVDSPVIFATTPIAAESSGGGSSSAGSATTSVDAPTATASETAPPPPSNALYVLDEQAGDLSIVGKIEGIAPNERLYSARMMDDVGFLVTFRRIDPLFTLDLSDPTAPAIVGELKIPGYSDYLHPVGDHLLIGVGRTVSPLAWGIEEPDKLQLSLFDISDLANPKVVQQLALGGSFSTSEVSNTHKAFTFLPDKNLLAIPANLTNSAGPAAYNYSVQNTLLVFRVADSGFTQLGSVDFAGPGYYSYWGGYDTRGVIINDDVFAVDSFGVRAVGLSDFSQVATVDLPDTGDINYGGPYPVDVAAPGVATRGE